jgi:hypothetical protein
MNARRFALALAAAAPLVSAAPGDGTFKAPAPVIEAPAKGARFALEAGASLELRIRLPDAPFGNAANIAAFAAASPEQERWHIDVLRRGPGSSEEEVSAFAGPLTALRFGENIGKRMTAEWFEQHGGAGPYRIRAYLSQQVGGALNTGAAATVDFDVVAPVKSAQRGPHTQPRHIATATVH